MENNNTFNLEGFLERQKTIWTKYDSIENISLLKSEKLFINNLDRYILHTLEEVYEFKGAYLQNDYFENYISELNDVVMYLGTMLSIVYENLNLFSPHEVSPDKLELEISESNYVTVKDLSNYTLDVLMEIRMLYKKRKWHKSSQELSHDEKYNSLLTVKEALELLIADYLSFTCTEIQNEMIDLKVETMIYDKQEFIINLKERN